VPVIEQAVMEEDEGEDLVDEEKTSVTSAF
jgi:hypothetical protein